MKFVDTHCHILDPRIVCRADEIVSSMENDGLDFIVEISASVPESRESVAFANRHKNVFCTIGVHPHVIDGYSDEFERWAMSQSCNCCGAGGKIVGYGECGLDYHHMAHPARLQQEIFARQILLADRLGLPLVIHERDSFEDLLRILVDHKDHIRNGLLFHCFSEGAEEVAMVRQHFDAYFAFGGGITYCDKSIDAVKAVPIDRMVLETDAPYLNPKQNGGKKILNEPKNVRIIAQYIAEILDMPIEDVAKHTTANARRFFRITD